ncbi:hypothetical protein D3C72_1809920 [compost metagenome]
MFNVFAALSILIGITTQTQTVTSVSPSHAIAAVDNAGYTHRYKAPALSVKPGDKITAFYAHSTDDEDTFLGVVKVAGGKQDERN